MRLILFDIDLTLLDPAGAGRRSMELAFAELFAVGDPFRDVPFAGFTDRWILRQGLLAHGLLTAEDTVCCGPTTIPFDVFVPKFAATYAHHLAAVLPTRAGRVLPGVRQLLGLLRERRDAVLGLATGNFERGARLKLAHHGLEGWFASGGFGDHHLERAGVVAEALARFDGVQSRLGAGAPERTSPTAAPHGTANWTRVLVIGDTPHDIVAGRAVGALTVGVASGLHGADELRAAGADLVYPSFADADRIAVELAEA